MDLREELIAYELKISVCSDKQAETKVDSYLFATKPQHGGKRLNAGSKPKYNEPTKTTAFRVPISKTDEVKKLVREFLAGCEI